jgi:hypothetical protein
MTLRKRALIVAVLALALALVPGVAMAFDSVHGGYALDTDACAGCHRAHTAASPITWQDGGGRTRSALLISTAETNDEFCYTCHGPAGFGADTNVWDGVFQSRDGDLGSDEVYNTDLEPLNGGGFNPAMFPTQHYPGGATWVAWGAGTDGRDGIISMGGEKVVISCGSCHDTHGSSNYRLLKDTVAGISPVTSASANVAVGGYDLADDPTPFVISAEQGYPVGGWPKGNDRMTLYTTYYPDFTTPRYAKAPGQDPNKGISGWCQACHTQMNTNGDSNQVVDANGAADDATGIPGGFQDYMAEIYDANDGFGLVERHRHPTNVALNTYAGSGTLALGGVPVGHTPNTVVVNGQTVADGVIADDTGDWVDCLSCHVAHGSSASMSGYASVADSTNPEPNTGTKTVNIDGTTIVSVGSVNPDYGNALLRLDNRGVCQACHNK